MTMRLWVLLVAGLLVGCYEKHPGSYECLFDNKVITLNVKNSYISQAGLSLEVDMGLIIFNPPTLCRIVHSLETR